jgi:hypothetical protein
MKWIKEEAWLVCMLVGISLLTWTMAAGAIHDWQIPIACAFIIIGIGIESTRT